MARLVSPAGLMRSSKRPLSSPNTFHVKHAGGPAVGVLRATVLVLLVGVMTASKRPLPWFDTFHVKHDEVRAAGRRPFEIQSRGSGFTWNVTITAPAQILA